LTVLTANKKPYQIATGFDQSSHATFIGQLRTRYRTLTKVQHYRHIGRDQARRSGGHAEPAADAQAPDREAFAALDAQLDLRLVNARLNDAHLPYLRRIKLPTKRGMI
jgi:hypothetical protein